MFCCLFCGYLVTVKRPRMTLNTLRLNLMYIKQTLLVRDKFWLKLVIYCFFFGLFVCFGLLFIFLFVSHRGGDEWKVRFFNELFLSTCVVPLWLDRFNSFNSPVFHVIVTFGVYSVVIPCTITDMLMICRKTENNNNNKNSSNF